MGISLIDAADDSHVFKVNYWHWRTIVEIILKLKVLPNGRVEFLNAPFSGHLSYDEAHQVAQALRGNMLESLKLGERIYMNGKHTMAPDDGTIHTEPDKQHLNYSISHEELEEFANYCAECKGFRVE